ncbi:MAG: hypothetical protein AAB090_07840 [Nitrospirota bacterium]
MERFIDLLFQPFNDFWKGFAALVPNLMAMLLILLAGILSARLVYLLLLRVFKTINFDTWCDRAGLTAVIRKGDVWGKPSEVFGHILYWLLLIIFLMIGLNALNLKAIDNLITQFLFYLPRVISALMILIVGYIIAGFLSRAALIAAVNSGYHYAKILAEAVRLLLLVLILAMALEQLQIAPGVVVAAFSIIFGGIVLALSIAFGVGGIDVAKRIIERNSEEKRETERDVEHI